MLSRETVGFASAAMKSAVSTPNKLAEIATEYPPAMVEEQLLDVDRIAYHIALVQHHHGKRGARICDIGGGVGLFAPGCAALGYETTLVDDFGDEVNHRNGQDVFKPHARLGVKILSSDVIAEPPAFAENSFDVITTFDSMEHWHHSPRRLFHMLKNALAPGGILIIGVPNCNNLRKRITTLLGRGHWSAIKDWYEPDVFRAHVREPSVSDLRYICTDLDMDILVITGRNWLGRVSYPLLTKLTDPFLRVRAGLCSDLYVVAAKRARSAS
jgi:2-polyprenyl-3-methyl-5-hydroxy-6-metoxy-1,4-benzoquinol methylase